MYQKNIQKTEHKQDHLLLPQRVRYFITTKLFKLIKRLHTRPLFRLLSKIIEELRNFFLFQSRKNKPQLCTLYSRTLTKKNKKNDFAILTSHKSMSESVKSAAFNAFFTASTGPEKVK